MAILPAICIYILYTFSLQNLTKFVDIYCLYPAGSDKIQKMSLKWEKVLRNMTSYGKIYELHVKFCNDMCRVLSFVKFCWWFWATQIKSKKHIKTNKKH